MSFPAAHLVPKRATQASELIAEGHDGTGVLVAILDTGVDPGADGLQTCPDGRPKILDVLDCSGSGDVELKAKASADLSETEDLGLRAPSLLEDDGIGLANPGRKLTVLSGRVVTLGHGTVAWTCPSNEFRLGTKAAYDVFPKPVVNRMKQDRKEAWMRQHAAAEAQAQRALQAAPAGPQALKADVLRRKNLEDAVEVLKQAKDSYQDLGPTLDVICYQDSERIWRVLVVTPEDSDDLSGRQPLAPFRAERQYAQFGWGTKLNYCVSVSCNGTVATIVVDSGAHGTHVAGIVAAHFPQQPELNGVAPGAQIISLKIGDGRLDGMETGSAIVRALTACALAGVNLVNMSFGEPTKMPGGGRVIELCRQLVLKHGVVFVSSAGNTGPALSTVGAPGGSTPHLIGVGAFVETNMMLAEYAFRKGETPNETSYTWSSRGPTGDGQLGVSVCAPGAAVTCVPTWTLQAKQLMNGTSMASPSACGCIALILSALKKQGKTCSPVRIRRALEQTARIVEGADVFGQGHGLIQAADALRCLQSMPSSADAKHWDVPFEVRIPSRPSPTQSGSSHGIYLREPYETANASEVLVEVHPLFDMDQDNQDVGFAVDKTLRPSKQDRVDMQVRVRLQIVGQGPLGWVRAPQHVFLTAVPVSFKVVVDPTVLTRGQAFFGEVVGFDEAVDAQAGPLFRIPITVIVPEAVGKTPSPDMEGSQTFTPRLAYEPRTVYPRLSFGPGVLVRKYLAVPHGATWCDVRIASVNEGATPPADGRTFVLHCLQLRPMSRYRDDELEAMVRVESEPGASVVRSLRVYAGGTLEVVVGQWWSALGNGDASLEVRFSGVTLLPSQLSLGPHNGWTMVASLRADLKDCSVEPSAELKASVQAFAPVRSVLEPCRPDSGNSLLGAVPPDSRVTWQLTLDYELPLLDKGSKFKLRLPAGISDMLYESPLEGILMSVLDSRKKPIGWCDYISSRGVEEFTAPGGALYAQLVLAREKDQGVLDRLVDCAVLLERLLSSSISLSCHARADGPITGEGKFSNKQLRRGQEVALALSLPNVACTGEDVHKRLPAGVKPGDVLVGTLSLAPKKSSGWGAQDAPGGYPVSLVVPPKSQTSKPGASLKPAPVPETEWEMSLFKARAKLLEAASDAVFAKEHPETLVALRASGISEANKAEMQLDLDVLLLRREASKLRALLKDPAGDDDIAAAVALQAGKVNAQSEAVLAGVDLAGLLRQRKPGLDEDGFDASPLHTEKFKQREARAVEALLAKTHAALDAAAIAGAPLGALPMDAMALLLDSKDPKLTQVKLRLARKDGRIFTALSLLDVLAGLDDAALGALPDPTSQLEVLRLVQNLLEQAEWEHLASRAAEAVAARQQ